MLEDVLNKINKYNALLVAVSKTKSPEEIMIIYNKGHRHFGENRARELEDKHKKLPEDIHWHMIGHLQKNKAKYICGFVDYIHSVDSLDLLEVINRQAVKHNRLIKILLQMKIGQEESKYGMDLETTLSLIANPVTDSMKNIQICGLMGMASFTSNKDVVGAEFEQLRAHFDHLKKEHFSKDQNFKELSMGMSGDYEIAMDKGATMVRIGSLIFGAR